MRPLLDAMSASAAMLHWQKLPGVQSWWHVACAVAGADEAGDADEARHRAAIEDSHHDTSEFVCEAPLQVLHKIRLLSHPPPLPPSAPRGFKTVAPAVSPALLPHLQGPAASKLSVHGPKLRDKQAVFKMSGRSCALNFILLGVCRGMVSKQSVLKR